MLRPKPRRTSKQKKPALDSVFVFVEPVGRATRIQPVSAQARRAAA